MIQVFQKGINEWITLNREQEELVHNAVNDLKHGAMLVQYSAPAGCGKSVVLRAIMKEMGYDELDVAPMAYTGAAAMVMRKNGFTTAKTCHSWIYKPVMEKITYHGRTVNATRWKWVPMDPKPKLILLDEASMVPRRIREDIEKNGVPVVACGDLFQLPPVSGDSAYLHEGHIYHLTQIMRQRRMSSIVLLGEMLRNQYQPRIGDYGDVLVVPESRIDLQTMINAHIIITFYHNRREMITRLIRNALGYKSPLPSPGEKIVCKENNWDIGCDGINLVNGMIGYCESLDSSISQMDSRKKNVFHLDFRSYNFPDIVFYDLQCDYDYFTAVNHQEREEIMRSERYFRNKNRKRHIPIYNKFEFAYAITVHASQGNQYHSGIYFKENINFISRLENFRTDYTALTRFINHCIYVVPDYVPVRKSYFEGVDIPKPQQTPEIKKCVMFINGQPQI